MQPDPIADFKAKQRETCVHLVAGYLADNVVRHEYLLTRAAKA